MSKCRCWRIPIYEKRIVYYACRLHQQQLREGQDYLELRPTISISFLNHVWLPQVPDWHLRFRLLEEAHHFPLTEDVEFHILELPKFTKSSAELMDGLDKWLYFLRHAEMMEVGELPAKLQRPLVIRALEELKMLTQTDLERERYEACRKAQFDSNTLVKAARLEGREEGLVEGTIRIIHLCERLLHRPQTLREELALLPLDELTRRADELQGLLK